MFKLDQISTAPAAVYGDLLRTVTWRLTPSRAHHRSQTSKTSVSADTQANA